MLNRDGMIILTNGDFVEGKYKWITQLFCI